MEYVWWMANFPGLNHRDVDDLPLNLYMYGPAIKRLYDAKQNGVSFTLAEPGWREIELHR